MVLLLERVAFKNPYGYRKDAEKLNTQVSNQQRVSLPTKKIKLKAPAS